MSHDTFAVDEAAAVERLMRFLAVGGVTGDEARIADDVWRALAEAGVPDSAVRIDDANSRIPLPTATGNLVVRLPGTRPGPARLFVAHLDTVPLAAGAVPRRDGDRIVPAGRTALGGDNRTGVAVLVTLAAELAKHRPDHPPLVLLFTVREESGLFGARHLDPAGLDGVQFGFNFDGKRAADVILGAVGAERWEADVFGKASHAGVAPEQGVSASLVAALALAEVHAGGWFGKVVQGGTVGTSNVGTIGGRDGGPAGDATNVVTDFVHVKGESRSHDPDFPARITAAYEAAFHSAAARVRDAGGTPARVEFRKQQDYFPFRLAEDDPAVRAGIRAVEAMGWTPNPRVADGGLDANWLVRHGVPTVTFGAGQNNIHTVDEWVDVPEFVKGCRLALALASLD